MRHWDSEAVFSPRPKRPRSSGRRSVVGLVAARRIAVTASSRDIPVPSSKTAISKGPDELNRISTFDALAATELSITSATADSMV